MRGYAALVLRHIEVIPLDKYEYNLKLDQMKSLYADENYEAAAEIADNINWNKVKNANALVKAGEIYEKVQRYNDSRDILLMAYDRSPIGRMIIYRLAEVAIKMKDFSAANDYYEEFVQIAPHDSLKYVILYDMKKGQGSPYTELIPILEQLKEQEYSEEWAYELAYLYHKAGKSDECIEACDELILWFGDGPYVERALELKMLYQPLSKTQEEKYRAFRQQKDGYTRISSDEMLRSGEYIHEAVSIPQVSLNTGRFNTTNLQEEIARGMEQIMNATEKETVSDTMDNIKKIVEEIPYLQIQRETEETAPKEVHIETDEEIDGSLKINFQELIGEDSDGQMSLVVPEKTSLERQITGQMSIADVLEEWEKTKRAAETALQDAEQRRLKSAKARALQEAGDIMDRLTDVIPKLDAGVTPKELLEEEYLHSVGENLPEIEEDLPETAAAEEAVLPEGLEKGLQAGLEEIEKELQIKKEEPEEEVLTELPENDIQAQKEQEAGQLFEDMNSILEKEIARLNDENALIEQQIAEVSEEIENTRRMPELARTSAVQKNEQYPDKVHSEESSNESDTEQQKEEEASGWKPITELTNDQKAVFSYFVPVRGMEEQLCRALNSAMQYLSDPKKSSAGNLIIQGGHGCGKTVLATSVIKVLQKETGRLNGKVGKIHADALNTKDIQKLLRKLSGGCLIIEAAGDITRETAVTLSLLLEQDESGILLILEDTTKGIKKALSTDDGFAKRFTESITVPVFSNDDLVLFARSYSRELGYEIDEMAILALYNRINNIQKLDQATTLTEVKDIVDEAIEREEHGGLKKAFGILTAKRYTSDDKIILRERDFG